MYMHPRRKALAKQEYVLGTGDRYRTDYGYTLVRNLKNDVTCLKCFMLDRSSPEFRLV